MECGALSVTEAGTTMMLMLSALNWDSILQVYCAKIRKVVGEWIATFNLSLLVGSRPRYGAFYGQGSGPIFLSGLECAGTEKSLLNCSWNALDGEYCRHYEDAGVACQGIIADIILLLHV